MKKIITISFVMLGVLLASAQEGKECSPEKEKLNPKKVKARNGEEYGEDITRESALDVTELPKVMESVNEMTIKIKGTVSAVCQVKGCWMTADLGNGKTMRIRFKDYAFFVPKDCDGKTFYAQGVASWNTTSVAQLRHYAEDAGKSADEIAKITAPQRELVFLASGVIIEKK